MMESKNLVIDQPLDEVENAETGERSAEHLAIFACRARGSADQHEATNRQKPRGEVEKTILPFLA